MSQLVVHGVDPADQGASWEALKVRNLLWHMHEASVHAPRSLRPDLAKARGIVLTEAGRAYLRELRGGI